MNVTLLFLTAFTVTNFVRVDATGSGSATGPGPSYQQNDRGRKRNVDEVKYANAEDAPTFGTTYKRTDRSKKGTTDSDSSIFSGARNSENNMDTSDLLLSGTTSTNSNSKPDNRVKIKKNTRSGSRCLTNVSRHPSSSTDVETLGEDNGNDEAASSTTIRSIPKRQAEIKRLHNLVPLALPEYYGENRNNNKPPYRYTVGPMILEDEIVKLKTMTLESD